MKVTRRFDQNRRDLSIDLECENCGATDTETSAYDDTHYWVNVVPNIRCKKCEKTSVELGIRPENIGTKYPAGLQV